MMRIHRYLAFIYSNIKIPMDPKEGDYIEVDAGDATYTGVLMPATQKSDNEHIVLKLDSGYNVGVSKKKIKSIKRLKEVSKAGGFQPEKVKEKPGLPKICILHTGGTIASKVDYRTGAVYSSFTPEDLLQSFPELKEIANFSSKLVGNMWSDDLRFAHFKLIAEAVKEQVEKGVDGIIIGMGTDNLAVASAALAFIFEKLPVPVIFVGAQRSSDRGSSDAAMNLVCASRFISKTDFAGVAICMHASSSDDACAILPATKTCKLHSSRRDAFKAVNASPIAEVDKEGRIKFLVKAYAKRGGELIMRTGMEDKVGLIKISINMFPEQFLAFAGFKGLVIEGTGLGHTPGQTPDAISKPNAGIYKAIKGLVDSGTLVVMTTQCLFGRVNMHVYDKGEDLVKLGVVSGEDMLANTALVKLSWLLGNYSKEEAKRLVGENLRGEISERSEERFVV
jgi:glutamyl-tRNA(Gln) amidotransferase subunit D